MSGYDELMGLREVGDPGKLGFVTKVSGTFYRTDPKPKCWSSPISMEVEYRHFTPNAAKFYAKLGYRYTQIQYVRSEKYTGVQIHLSKLKIWDYPHDIADPEVNYIEEWFTQQIPFKFFTDAYEASTGRPR